MVEDSLYGPTVLWGLLKGKKVKSNDGKDLGDLDKISQNYIRLEKGTIKKKKSSGFLNTWLMLLMEKCCGSLPARKKPVQSSSMVTNHQ